MEFERMPNKVLDFQIRLRCLEMPVRPAVASHISGRTAEVAFQHQHPTSSIAGDHRDL